MKIPPAGSVPTAIALVAVAVATAASWAPGRLLAAEASPAPQATASISPPPASPEAVRRLLNRYCVACHNERRVAAVGGSPSVLDAQIRDTGLALDVADAARPSADAELWERVIARLRAGSMPPAGRPRPGADEARAVASWLEARIDRVAAANPNPGRTGSMHRLNRTEYGNAIRDLLALEIDVAALLPGDETSDTGFDNNAAVLSISTAQLERYLSAARKISRLATGVTTAPDFARFENSVLLTQADRQHEDLPLGSRGGLSATHHFPADGNYIFRIALTTNWQDYVRGMGRRNLLDLRIDGSARPAVHGRGRGAGHAGPHHLVAGGSGRPRVGAVRPRVGRPPGSPRAGGCGTARRRGLVRAQPVGARGTAAAGDEGRGPVERREVSRERGGPGADHRGPLRGSGPRRHAEPAADLRVPPRRRAGGGGVRRAHPVQVGTARLSPAARGWRHRDAAHVLPRRAGEAGGQLRYRHPARAGTAARRSGLPPAGAGGPGRRGAGAGVRASRSGARLAPVVLPVEQHPRRGAARRRRARRADGSRHVARAGAAHAGGPAQRGAGEQLRHAVAAPAEPGRRQGRARRLSRVRPGPAGGVPAGDGVVHRQHHRRRTAASWTCSAPTTRT